MEQSVKRISKKLEKADIFGVYAAYKSLRPVAFRKDLWMHLILWDQGGVYMDSKFFFTRPVSNWLDWDEDESILCGDNQHDFSCYFNGFMATR